MIRKQGLGYGYNDGCGQEFDYSAGFGDGFGEGYGYGNGFGGHGDGVRYGYGTGYGNGFGAGYDTVYATPLVIDTDPITTAYQALTMQTTGDHHG